MSDFKTECGIEILPCPFCGSKRIRIIENEMKNGFFKGSKYTYCWCKMCGTKGPWAYSVYDDLKIVCKKCILRWNERS